MAAGYRWDDFVLELDAYRVERAGVPLPLEPKVFNLLALLVQRPGHVFTKQEIFDAIWPDTAVTDHALTRVVAQLRRALGDEAREARYIETVPTRGYRWIPPVQQIDSVADLTRSPAPTAAVAAAPPVPAIRRLLSVASAAAPRDRARPGDARGGGAPRALKLAAALALATLLLMLLVWTQRNTPTAATGIANDAATTASVAKQQPHPVQWPVQMTTHAGLDLHPALSRQGDAVAYASDKTGGLEIYVRALGGAATDSALTSDGGQNVQPAWSPDGRFIAFHSYRRGGIWIVPSRGGVTKQVAPVGSRPAWSPDGRQIAFQSDEHADVGPGAFGATSGSTIWAVGQDGAGLRQLTRPGQPMGGHAAPAWSPDGRYIAFTVFEGGEDNGMWLVGVDGPEARLLKPGLGLFELAFSADGSALYAAGGEALIVRFPYDAATGTIAGPGESIPVPGVPRVRGLSISADGRRIAFAGLALSSQIWTQRVERDGSGVGRARALTSDTSRRNSLPAVSPDGTRVAFMSIRSGEAPNVRVMDIDGRNDMQVTSAETAEWKPNWFPDGRRIAYLSKRGNAQGVWAVDIATRREELLFDVAPVRSAMPQASRPAGQLAEVDLAPSMTRAAFSLITPTAGRRATYITDLEPFAPRAVGDREMWIGYPSWSPDERQLAVEIKEGSSTHAAVIDIASGKLRRLTNERGQTWVRSWSPDGRRIALAALRDGLWNLRWVDVASGRQGQITAPEPPHVYVRYPEWSPRGDQVLFERGELRGNIWMLKIGQ